MSFFTKISNFRKTEDSKRNCMNCKFFYSFQAKLEDELEPSEYGDCCHLLMSDLNEIVGEGMICDLFDTDFINIKDF